jgi:hypothetical protein
MYLNNNKKLNFTCYLAISAYYAFKSSSSLHLYIFNFSSSYYLFSALNFLFSLSYKILQYFINSS